MSIPREWRACVLFSVGVEVSKEQRRETAQNRHASEWGGGAG